MKLGSLCSGFGGLDLAVEAHYGATTVWHAETDEDCAKVLAHHWPGVPNLGDLTVVDWGQVERPDVLAAGYPCAPYSHAGRRKGEDDERAIFAYIADAVSVLRPRVCVFENVAGHTSLGGPGVVATLTELGYDTRWGVGRASDPPVFAPHRRARWFCVAQAADTKGAKRREPKHETVGQTAQRTTKLGERPGPTAWGRYEPAIRRWERILGRAAPDPVTDGKLSSRFVSWMMGLPENWVCGLGLSRNAEIKMLGNGCMVQQAALGLEILDDQG